MLILRAFRKVIILSQQFSSYICHEFDLLSVVFIFSPHQILHTKKWFHFSLSQLICVELL